MIEEKLAFHILEKGKIKKWDELSFLLNSLIIKHSLVRKHAVIQLPAHLVQLQRLALPTGLTRQTLEEQVRLHLKRHILSDVSTLCFDYRILAEKSHECTELMVAAAEKSYLNAYLNCVIKAGLLVETVDIDIYALIRSLFFLLKKNKTLRAINLSLFMFDGSAFFIVFDKVEIMFDYQWEITDTSLFISNFQHQLQAISAAYPAQEIHILHVFSEASYQKIVDEISNSIEVILPKELSVESSFLIAYGLAMRELM